MLFITQNSELIIRLAMAAGLGMLIGVERVLVHKEAGMKTHALVAMGAALFTLISEALAARFMNYPGFSPTFMVSQIIVGIGFISAGSIILQGAELKGLTTAGGIWVTAGIGIAAGFGLYGLASVVTILTLFILVIVNIFEKPIRRFSDGINGTKE